MNSDEIFNDGYYKSCDEILNFVDNILMVADELTEFDEGYITCLNDVKDYVKAMRGED